MIIIFDNIIFSIQKAGGISVYWTEILNYFIKSNHSIAFFNYTSDNMFSKKINFNKASNLNSRNISLKYERYLNPSPISVNVKTIFHSSYYRVLKGKKIFNIVTVHDFTYEKKMKSFKRFIHIIQKRNALFSAKGIICISHNTKKDLIEIYPKLKNKKITVIYNSYDEENFFHKKGNVFNCNNVVFVGGRSGYKNFKTAVDAVSLSNELFLNIVGSELDNKEMDYLNLKLGSNRFKVYKYLKTNELNSLFNTSLCLLYLSEYEGFGIPIIESMASGCPVILLNTSSIPEIAGNAGIYVLNDSNSVFNKIIELKDNHKLREDYQKLGFENIKRFSWKDSCKKVEEFYEEVLSS